MQNKVFVKIIAVLLSLICLFYLSFSLVTRHYEGKAEKMGVAGQAYLDSLRQEEVYLGYTYKQCEELQIGLGLDLKGGMNVILEVSVPDVVKGLAGTYATNDPKFKAILSEAQEEADKSSEDFLDIFIRKYQAQVGKDKLGEVFALKLKEANITPNSSDSQVRVALEDQIKAAVENSYKVVQNRIDRFGVAQPNIQILEGRGQMGQIMVEMPGVKEPERVRKLLSGSANLEFWECALVNEINDQLAAVDRKMAEVLKGTAPREEVAEAATADSTATEVAAAETDSVDAATALAANTEDKAPKATTADEKAIAAAQAQHPLFSRLLQSANGQSLIYPQSCVVGLVSKNDTAAVSEYLHSFDAQEILDPDLVFAWGVKPSEMFKGGNMFELYALRKTNGAPALAGDVIESAKDDYDQYHRPIVSMSMNTDGAREWAMITKKNLKRPVAIVLDGVVYSAPTIQSEITGGNSQISGNFSSQDTQDLANVLTSGKTPAPTKIVSEQTVGPSIGAASVRAGFISCIVAFILLMIFMVLFYGVIPGMVANSALLLNFFFTFGVLTSFQAALTMSGIAGLVLSLGMAVDANVLIYERTKEELRAGKQVKEALADGYGNAFSAIFDSNLTSIITAVILYNVGTGPIRGFAMTLGIGIVASFFTAVWITRMVYEHFLNKDKWTKITFRTALSDKFASEREFAFMSQIKKSAVIFGILIAVSAVFLIPQVRGLQLGIDFKGGRNYVVEFEQPVQTETIKAAVQEKVGTEGTVSCLAIEDPTLKNAVRVSTTYKIEQNTEEVDQEVEHIIWEALSEGKFIKSDYDTFKDRDNKTGGSIISAQKVGSSVAADMAKGAVIATFLSLLAIFIYILVRFRNVAFSVGAICALTIDTFLIIGMYAICWGWMPFSLEVDQTFIGAILTAIGYSINDKVVVFDRIRENIGLYPTRDRELLFNQSLNSTLTRTIMTSVTTLLVLFVIFFLGGESIRSFDFAMILGVVFGTCSSIFLAAPIALKLMKRQVKKEAAKAAAEASAVQA